MRFLAMRFILFLAFSLSIGASYGAEFSRKQSGTTTIANGSTTRTIAITAIDRSKSFLVFSSTIDSNQPQHFQVGGAITNATTLTFARTGNTGVVSISWEVFEFESGVYVQHGSSTNIARGTPVDVTIGCVDLTKSFVLISARKSGSQLGADDGVSANLTTSTNMQLMISNNGPGGANMEEAYWQVIEYQGAVVKKLVTTLAAGSLSTTATISPAIGTLSKAFVVSNHWWEGDINAFDLPRTELTNASTVTYTRAGTTSNMNFVTYVVEFTDGSTVTRGTQNFTAGVTTRPVAITATSASGVIAPGNFGRQGSTSFSTDDNSGHNWFTYQITSSTNLQITRGAGTGSTADAPWQIITFEDTGLQGNTFYSRLAGPTAWESNTAWSYTPDGSSGAVPVGVYPRRANNVVIQNGHTIAIDNVNDNDPCSQSPDDLPLANVGTFTGSTDQMFYHTGDIVIADGGLLTSTEELMLAGYTLIADGGTLTVNEDLVNLGYFEVAENGNFSNSDDLVLSGNSITIINNLSFGADDIYIDWTNATLCGEGVMNLGNGGADPTIQFFNGGSLSQVCGTFAVTCTANCGAFPIAPTGSFSSGNSGPGGIGSTTASGDVRLWLDANTINQATGTNVTAWTDLSGYGNDAAAASGSEPVFRTGQLNGFPAVQFVNANSDYLQVADDASLDIQNVTLITVGNLAASSTAYASFLSKIQSGVAGFNGYALLRNNNLQSVSFAIDALGNEAQSAISYGVNAIHTGIYADPGMQHFVNESGPSTDSYAGPITSHNTPLYIGGTVNAAGSTPDRFLEGDIAETIVFSSVLDNIKRIILSNYLSSKYGIAIANDFHAMDTPGNGNFDYQVAGIGQASDGSFHKDARGFGIVRMWNPSALGNNEYLMWGHDNAALTGTTSGVDGIIIEQRYDRIWRVSETGDVGTVSISFDFNGIGNPLGSNLRLLIDRDGDGFADNDVAPVVGTVSGNIAVFSSVNFQNGDRFTLGNTDISSPLPIELTSFEAFASGSYVTVKWRTASELNNDFFTIEKSKDAENWEQVAIVNGAGTTQTPQQYEIVDTSPFTTRSYYRLKQTDFDGKFDYSPIALVKFDHTDVLHVFPNPSDGRFTLSVDHFNLSQIRLCNSLGQIVQASITIKDKFALIDISDAKPGVYVLQVFDGSSVRSARLIKN